MHSALKWLLFLPVFIFFFVFIKTPVLAAQTSISAPIQANQYLTPATNPDVPKNLHTYTQSVFIELTSSAICQLTGYDPLSTNHKCLGIDAKTRKIGFVENGGGLIGTTTNLMSMVFQMPTSTSQYVNYLAGNFGLAKKTYAANPCAIDSNSPNGVGFCSIKPLTTIWVKMRDLVYLIFTVVFIIIGLAIMLRVHIDPRTVMTVENQIPKIIVGILLVTFSLAIAGVLIDLMYIAIYLVGNVLTGVDPNLQQLYPQLATSGSPIDAAFKINNQNIDIVGKIAEGVTTLVTGNLRSIFQIPIIGDAGKIIFQLILYLIFLLAFWVTLFRIWLTLVIAYVTILLDVVFAPFWFLAGLLPGESLGVGAWFRDILSNLMVFPVTIAMFALAIIFSDNTVLGTSGTGQLFNPPLVGNSDSVTLGYIITFGFIFMTPQALSIVKSALKAPKFNLGPIFQPTSTAMRVISGTPRRLTEMGERWNYRQKDKTTLQRIFGYSGNILLREAPETHGGTTPHR